MPLGSTAIQPTAVYIQDGSPAQTETGIIWVDTSTDPPTTKVYNGSTSNWEPVAADVVKAQDTEPGNPDKGTLWIDTSGDPTTWLYDGAAFTSLNPMILVSRAESFTESDVTTTESGTATFSDGIIRPTTTTSETVSTGV